MKQYKIKDISGTEIVFRALSAEEADRLYSILKMTASSAEIEESIFNTITDNKYNIADLKAGIVPVIISLAFSISGLIKKNEDIFNFIDNTRDAINKNAYFEIYAKIAQFQKYTLDELKQKTLNEILELYAFSEKIAGQQFIDTKKSRESLLDHPEDKLKKKGVNKYTKAEIDSLKAAIQSSNFEDI